MDNGVTIFYGIYMYVYVCVRACVCEYIILMYSYVKNSTIIWYPLGNGWQIKERFFKM